MNGKVSLYEFSFLLFVNLGKKSVETYGNGEVVAASELGDLTGATE